jgi:hypothetical protein
MAITARGALSELTHDVCRKFEDEPDTMNLVAKLRDINAMMQEEVSRRAGNEGPFTQSKLPHYAVLADVLQDAYDQSAHGKGKERHVKGAEHAFIDQPICALQRIYGSGYAFGQASKKMEESIRLPKDAARAELLGAIVYIAAAVVVLDEENGDAQ